MKRSVSIGVSLCRAANISAEDSLARAIELQAGLAQERWRKAVDALWREVLYYRRLRLADRERERTERRLRNLRRIVRRALSEYHRLQIESSPNESSRP